jgi:Uri superfamily endonuclease
LRGYSSILTETRQIPDTPGSYVLVGGLLEDVEISAGKFGGLCLKAGVYFYCGSARGPGGLRARINRHFRLDKKKHWHYDHIRSHLALTHVWWGDASDSECDLCRWIGKAAQVSFPLAGFGSSDCVRGCRSHLIFIPSGTNLDAVEHYLSKKASGFFRIVVDTNLIESVSTFTGADIIEKESE